MTAVAGRHVAITSSTVSDEVSSVLVDLGGRAARAHCSSSDRDSREDEDVDVEEKSHQLVQQPRAASTEEKDERTSGDR